MDSEECIPRIVFDAHSGPAGQEPHGTIGWGTGCGPNDAQQRGTVTCLAVTGKVAIVGFSGGFESLFGPTTPVAGLARVLDGGGTASGLDTFNGQGSLELTVVPCCQVRSTARRSRPSSLW
jgi:hypothetical protein